MYTEQLTVKEQEALTEERKNQTDSVVLFVQAEALKYPVDSESSSVNPQKISSSVTEALRDETGLFFGSQGTAERSGQERSPLVPPTLLHSEHEGCASAAGNEGVGVMTKPPMSGLHVVCKRQQTVTRRDPCTCRRNV